jgi:hypothetical protein
VKVLGEWKALADALLNDAACEARGSAATTNLVLILSAAARAATAAAPDGAPAAGEAPADGRKPAAGRAKAAVQAAAAARQDMTLALGQALPALLRKFQSDAVRVRALPCRPVRRRRPAPFFTRGARVAALLCWLLRRPRQARRAQPLAPPGTQAAALVALARELKLEVFSLQRQEDALGALLALVAELLFKYADAAVVDACTRTLLHCATSGPDTLQARSPAEAWGLTAVARRIAWACRAVVPGGGVIERSCYRLFPVAVKHNGTAATPGSTEGFRRLLKIEESQRMAVTEHPASSRMRHGAGARSEGAAGQRGGGGAAPGRCHLRTAGAPGRRAGGRRGGAGARAAVGQQPQPHARRRVGRRR